MSCNLIKNRSISNLRVVYALARRQLIINKKLRSFKSSEYINEKGDGPYGGFGYLSLFSDPIDLAICYIQIMSYPLLSVRQMVEHLGFSVAKDDDLTR